MYLRYLYGAISTAIGDGSNLERWDLLSELSHHIMLEFTYWLARLRGNTAVLYHRPFWFIPIHLFVATGYTDASSVAVGSVVLSHAGENFVEPSYWSDNATPQAGKNFAEHGHVVDVCLHFCRAWTCRRRLSSDRGAEEKIINTPGTAWSYSYVHGASTGTPGVVTV